VQRWDISRSRPGRTQRGRRNPGESVVLEGVWSPC
jgi:hypothetical protein